MKIHNKGAILTGTIGGVSLFFFLIEGLQGIVANIFGIHDAKINYAIFNVYASFEIPADMGTTTILILLLSPTVFIFIFIEIMFLVLSKTTLGFYRFAIMVAQFFGLGYFILYVFFGAANVIFDYTPDNDWLRFTKLLGLEYPTNVLVLLFIVLVFLAYLNFSTKRITKYINS